MTRARLALAAAALLIAGASAWWWSQSSGAGLAGLGGGHSTVAGVSVTAPNALAVPARPDTRTGNTHRDDPFLTPELLHQLEAMLLEAGEAGSPEELKRRLAALVHRHFPAEFATRALALAERYVDYRVALGSVKPPADPGDPRALRGALEARQKVRERYFSAEEYDALFAQGDALDRYTVARLEIERNASLTASQKQAALRQAEQELGPEQLALRAQASAHLAVAEQTAAWNAQGVGDNERYAQRAAQHGTEAAQRLARLDQDERDWQSRLSQYANARSQALSPAQLQQLRDQLFNQGEQLRLEAALTLQAQVSTAKR